MKSVVFNVMMVLGKLYFRRGIINMIKAILFFVFNMCMMALVSISFQAYGATGDEFYCSLGYISLVVLMVGCYIDGVLNERVLDGRNKRGG